MIKYIEFIVVGMLLTMTVSAQSGKPFRYEAVPMVDSTNIGCGVLYVTKNPETGGNDIYLADPERKTQLNLTRGRIKSGFDDGPGGLFNLAANPTTGRIKGGFDGPWGPVGSPDGQSVLFHRKGGDHSGVLPEPTDIYVLGMDGLTIRKVPEEFNGGNGFKWSSDSRSFIFRTKTYDKAGETNEQYVVVDRETLKTTSISTNDTKILRLYVSSGIRSADGQYEIEEESMTIDKVKLYINSVDGSKKTRVDFKGLITKGAAWAPDRNLLAFWGISSYSPDYRSRLLVVGPNGKYPTPIGQNSKQSGLSPPSWLVPHVIRVKEEPKAKKEGN